MSKPTQETAKLLDDRSTRADEPLVLRVFADEAAISFPLPLHGEVTIGRSRDADIALPDATSLSRRHAILDIGPRLLRLTDLKSSHGTFFSRKRLSPGESVDLHPGEMFELGEVMMVVLRGPAPRRPRKTGAIVKDPVMQGVYRLVEQVAQGSIPVLVLGETGVGKERVAEAVHQSSPRAKGVYLRLNCASLTESLAESELFGHAKGAFTGAQQPHQGLIEAAEGGTVFLDEVGELSLPLQAKLLRVLEDRVVRRVGEVKPREVNVRFVSATNRDLEAEIAAGRFRRDLYFRLAGVTVTVPPLRERRSEIAPIALAFLEQAAAELKLPQPPKISEEALRLLSAHSWPGNIRELRNVIERAVLMCGKDPIGPEHLPVEKLRGQIPAPSTSERGDPDERQRIVDALQACGGNQTQAAKRLGFSRRTLLHRLDEHGLPRPIKKQDDT